MVLDKNAPSKTRQDLVLEFHPLLQASDTTPLQLDSDDPAADSVLDLSKLCIEKTTESVCGMTFEPRLENGDVLLGVGAYSRRVGFLDGEYCCEDRVSFIISSPHI